MAKLAEIRCFYRNLVRTVFVSFACVLSAISFGYAGEEFECSRIVLGVPVENQEQYDKIVEWGKLGDPVTYVRLSSISGIVSYEGMCSNTSGQLGDVGNPEQAGPPNGGKYCWCRVNGFTPDGEPPQSLTGYPWVFMVTTQCKQNDECANVCADPDLWKGTLNKEDIARVQQTLYTKDDPECVYELKYDCNDLVGGGSNIAPVAQNVSYYQSFATYSSSECHNHPSFFVLAGWDWDRQQQIDACPTTVDYATSTSYLYPHQENKTLYAHWCEMRNECPNGGIPIDWNDYWDSGAVTMEAACTGSSSMTPPSATGGYCWCRANYDDGGHYSAWVYADYSYNDYNICSSYCLNECNSWSGRHSYLLTDGCKYKVRYECRNGSSQSPSIPSSGSEYFFGQTVNLIGSVSGCSVNQNELFTGWECVDEISSNNVNSQNNPYSFTMPQENVTCTAQWEEPCGDGTLVTEILGEENAADDYVDWDWLDNGFNGDITGEVYGGNGNSLGTVEYEGMCSNTPGTLGMSGNPQPSASGYCWCRVSGFTPAGGSGIQPLTDYPWVYFGGSCTPTTDCKEVCYRYKTWYQLGGLLSLFHHNLYTRYMCEYNLTYNCNNGNGNQTNMSGGTREGGVNVSLWGQSANNNHVGSCYIPNNSDFNGWDCVSSGGSSVSVNNNQITMPYDNVTCTAQWTPRKYNVTFVGGDSNNNGTGTPATGSTAAITNQLSGATITLPANGFSAPSGYVFNGWSCNQSIGTRAAGATFTMPANDVICTAQWTPKTNPIIYKCGILNNDATAHDTTYVATGATQDLTSIEPVYCTDASTLGYTFSHWKCCYTNANTLQGNVGTTPNCPANTGQFLWSIGPGSWIGTVCEAQWVPSEYTVTYLGGNCNAVAASIPENVSSGTPYNVKNPSCQNSELGTLLPGLSSSCRRFVGWATTSGGDVVYGSCDSTGCTCGDSVTISGNMNLYAVCEDVPYDVIYYGGNCGNDLTPYTDENVLTYGMNSEYSVRPVEEMGWSGISTSQFQGWSDSPDLSEICATQSSELYQLLRGGHTENSSLGYSPADECSNVELYAVCCPLNLNWFLDGGSWPADSSGNQTTCDYGTGDGITPLQTPIKPGYTFDGWKVTDYSTP